MFCSFTEKDSSKNLNYDELASKECIINGDEVNLIDFVDKINLTKEELYSTKYYKIYSNMKFDKSAIVNNSIVLHYDLNDYSKGYDAVLYINLNNNVDTFYFQEQEKYSLNYLCFSIKRFVINTLIEYDFNQHINIRGVSKNSNEETFVDYDSFREQINCGDKGYFTIEVSYSVYKVSNESSLYIVKTRTGFVPGAVANANGDSSYDTYKNSRGYIHMTISKAYDANDSYAYPFRYGATPYYKDFWPLTSPSTVSITSSITAGLNIGYSGVGGFASEGAYIEAGQNIEASISFGYSKTITTSEPEVSAQTYDKVLEYREPNQKENVVEAQWSYKYKSDRSETYYQDGYYMFEMSNNGRDIFSGDFRVNVDVQMIVDKGFWWVEQTCGDNLDLVVRPSYVDEDKKSIYHFSYGMI